jgi:hypothetical protein
LSLQSGLPAGNAASFTRRDDMRVALLWLLGIPLPVILILFLLGVF